MDFSKFDSMFDIEGLKADIKSSAENSKDFDPIPAGEYEVKITKMELTESKKGDPMFCCWFKILAGDQKDRLIFMNQVINKGFQIHIINEFLRSLGTDEDIHFDNFSQYSQLIYDVHEQIDSDKLEFALDYGMKNNFPTFKITEVFESEKIPS